MRKHRKFYLATMAVFVMIVVTACSIPGLSGPAAPAADANATNAALALQATAMSMQLTQLAQQPPTVPPPTNTPEPPTATPLPTATNTPAGPIVVDDDFSSDTGRFKCDYCKVENGAFFVGPWPVADTFDAYFALCEECGVVSSFKMSVDAWYVEGASDRGFGLMLRHMDDKSFIDIEITTWQVYGIWHFDPNNGWDTGYPYSWVKGGLKPGRATNHIEVTMDGAKGSLSISINGVHRLSDVPPGRGQVGLVVGMHSLGVAFDNFHFEEIK
jgi:hypothetical protein